MVFVLQRWGWYPAAATSCLTSSINSLCEGKVRFNSIIVKAGDWETSHAKSRPFATAGISGKGPAGSEASDTPVSTGGAFARMSDVIPPLPAPHSTTDDDDWEA